MNMNLLHIVYFSLGTCVYVAAISLVFIAFERLLGAKEPTVAKRRLPRNAN